MMYEANKDQPAGEPQAEPAGATAGGGDDDAIDAEFEVKND